MVRARYEILKYIQHEISYKDWGVKITRGAITQDNLNGNLLLQLKFQNISNINIKEVFLSIESYDEDCIKVSEKIGHNYNYINVYPGDFFGDDNPIILTSTKTRKIKIFLEKIVYSDLSFIEYINNEISTPINNPNYQEDDHICDNNEIDYGKNRQYSNLDQDQREDRYQGKNQDQYSDRGQNVNINLKIDKGTIDNDTRETRESYKKHNHNKLDKLRDEIKASKSKNVKKNSIIAAIIVVVILIALYLIGSYSQKPEPDRYRKLDEYMDTISVSNAGD
ncbi:hypothetical protein [Metaclostridioides mangenotii]|uniref:Uncharacterized protein n=1 Tax=Metaclostridioides mangenotii TaxID=1540 RepID=A0ABS4EB48_9FIRM|nr:hypothetical protein [Clostridioides mangenotii]MBP1855175.1 hypothetical protein [Clostridioides mangenotii]